MNNSEHYRLYCCGSRGSESVEGSKFNEFGGYTSCYILKKKNYALVIDCGTGFYAAKSILKDCSDVDIVFTHMHYDHILGLLDWSVLNKKTRLNIYGKFQDWFGEKTMDEFFRPPFWPVKPNFNIHEVPSSNSLIFNESLNVRFFKAPHPDNSSLLVIEDFFNASVKSEKIVVMFDSEESNAIDEKIIKDCDILIYDGMYDDDEYPKHKGWGHSTWQEGCRLAKRINARQLIITHHEPRRTDEQLHSFEKSAQLMFPNTEFARGGQSWDVAESKKNPIGDQNKNKDKVSFSNFIHEFLEYVKLALVDLKKMRHLSCMLSCATLGLVSLFMTIVNIITLKVPVLYATAAFTVLCAINVLIYLRIPKLHPLANILFETEIVLLISFFLITGSPEGFSSTWALLIPTVGMLVFGRAETTALSAVILVIMIFLFDTNVGRSFLMYPYTQSFLLRFPMAFLAFYMIAFVIETIRRKTLSILMETKESQEKMIASQTIELRDQNYELLDSNSRLETRSQLLYKTFGKLLPDEIVSSLLNNDGQPDFGGRKETISALQADIRGFTAMTNRMDALSVMNMLNHYLGEMTNIIQGCNGVVTEFMGDGILAIFGGLSNNDTHAEDCVRAALKMQKAIKGINRWNKENGYPEIEIGIGINSGEAVLGVVGNEQRLKYDAIGRTINITARIESYSTGSQILIGEDTYNRISNLVEVNNRFKVFPKGLDVEMNVYEVVAIQGKEKIEFKLQDNTLTRLDKPIAVHFRRVVDDHSEINEQKGTILAMSKDSLILKSKVSMNLFDNVNIDYNNGVLGMVTNIHLDQYTIRFTYKAEKK